MSGDGEYFDNDISGEGGDSENDKWEGGDSDNELSGEGGHSEIDKCGRMGILTMKWRM